MTEGDGGRAVQSPGAFLRDNAIWVVLAVGLVMRIWIASLIGHESDLTQFETWSRDLADGGPFNFYGGEQFKDYLPGYLYVLWVLGLLQEVFGYQHDTYLYLLKIPAVVADLASAFLLYLFLADRPRRVRLAAAATYLVLPTVLFIGALWGQTDSILAFFILLCAYLMVRGHPVLAALAFGLAFVTKPQAVAALPFLAFWGVRDHPPKVWLQAAVAGTGTALLLAWPFFPENPLKVINHARESTEVYGHNSSFAFNFWGIFGWFRADSSEFYYIEWRWWGMVLTLAADAWIIYALRRARGAGMMALGVGLCTLSFFVFQTRMHERYMFATFLPLLAACFYLNRPVLWVSFVGLTIVQYLSLYKAFFHPFFNAGDPGFLHYGWLDRLLEYSPHWWHSPGQFMWFVTSLFVVGVTLVLLAYAFLLQNRVAVQPVESEDELTMGRPNVFS